MTRDQLEDEGDPGGVLDGLDDCYWCEQLHRPDCEAEAKCSACMCGACLVHGHYMEDGQFFCSECLADFCDVLLNHPEELQVGNHA